MKRPSANHDMQLLSQYSTDKRTHSGQERLILEQVIQNGGFSIFWITENQKRAYAGERLRKSGIISIIGGSFPWHKVEVVNKNG